MPTKFVTSSCEIRAFGSPVAERTCDCVDGTGGGADPRCDDELTNFAKPSRCARHPHPSLLRNDTFPRKGGTGPAAAGPHPALRATFSRGREKGTSLLNQPERLRPLVNMRLQRASAQDLGHLLHDEEGDQRDEEDRRIG